MTTTEVQKDNSLKLRARMKLQETPRGFKFVGLPTVFFDQVLKNWLKGNELEIELDISTNKITIIKPGA